MNSKTIEKRFDVIRTLLAIAISLGIALVIIIIVSDNPGNALYNFLIGPLTSPRRFANVIELSIPLMFCGLAVSIVFAAGQNNMAAEGSFYVACAVSSVVAVLVEAPRGVHAFVCILAGTATGICIMSIPAILKLKWQANELVSSLMLNYICLYMGNYLIRTKVLDTSLGITSSLPFRDTASLPNLIPGTRLHLGLLFVIAAVIICWFMMYKTKLGYAIRIIGQNQNFAKYAGIGVGATVLGAQVIGGALAGFGGAVEMTGMYNRFQYQGLPQYGFDGMLIAIIAKYNPALVPVAAIFLSYIRTGADIMNRTSDVPYEIISIIQSAIIMLVVAKMFLNKFKHQQIVKYSRRELEQKEVSEHEAN